MNEDKSTRYHRHRRWAEVLATSARVLALVGCIGFGFSSWRVASAGLVNVTPPVVMTLAQAVALSVLCDLAALPFIVYSRFWLERRYRKAQPRLVDWLRGYGRAIGVHAACWICCALAVYLMIRQWPTTWWLVAGGTFAVVTLTLTRGAARHFSLALRA